MPCLASDCENFNPRSYKRSDSFIKLFFDFGGLFQSTLLQEERQAVFVNLLNFSVISIHAPTRGATRSGMHPKMNHLISIHAPTRGATHPLTAL